MICAKCREKKPVGDFNKFGSWCRQCRHDYKWEWKYNNQEKDEQIKESKRVSQKRYSTKKRPYNKASLARAKVYHAIKMGKMVRASKCSNCPRTIKIEGHHPDYSKPLEVLWLCNRCHRTIHTGYELVKT